MRKLSCYKITAGEESRKAMEADTVLFLFHDPKQIKRLKVCLHDIFEYPVVITGVLRKVEKFLTEDVRLREQHRVLPQKLKEAV